ncbi:hypothetical protein [Micromonospora sp. 4G55]|uniref:hypothetical protein n=1 Tax=Micromonospora sp. 4G55 TaxID=2806102 RepID=UPI001A45507C|nr:hypothetical protein [Micromonospora sp. 4G55]MBM0255529.1 hypothetical protein [Micromonospora sp. 4G55]
MRLPGGVPVQHERGAHGRRVAFLDGATVGEDLVCSLEETLIPAWSESRTPDWWRDEYSGKPVRLMIECERDGLPACRVPAEVDVIPDLLTTVL